MVLWTGECDRQFTTPGPCAPRALVRFHNKINKLLSVSKLCRLPETPGNRGTCVLLLTLRRRVRAQRRPDQHRALAIFSPVIATERAVLAQHLVTRNEPGNRIGTDRIAHGALAARAPQRLRERRIGGDGAVSPQR